MRIISTTIFTGLFLSLFLPAASGQIHHTMPAAPADAGIGYIPYKEAPNTDNADRLPWYHPRHLKIQYAGSIGFLSVGAGTRIGGSYEPGLYYGLLANGFGGSSVTVHTVSLKNSFYLTDKPWLNHFYPKAGVSLNWGHTGNTFRSLPPHYPEKYYFQNKLHLAPFWGGEWQFNLKKGPFKKAGFYFEFSALDAYLLEAIRTRYVKITDVWSLAFGLTIYLH